MSNRNTILNLMSEFSKVVDKKLSSFKCDTTFKSTVWKINDDGTYAISYKGQLYNVPNATKSPLVEGQSVWVKIPSGIFRNMYIDGLGKGNITALSQDIDDVIDDLNALSAKVNSNITKINNIENKLDNCITLLNNTVYEPLEL